MLKADKDQWNNELMQIHFYRVMPTLQTAPNPASQQRVKLLLPYLSADADLALFLADYITSCYLGLYHPAALRSLGTSTDRAWGPGGGGGGL